MESEMKIQMQVRDMPKLESPYVREMIDGKYVVTPKVAEGYEWVFEDESVKCIEKLDGCLHYQVPILTSEGSIEVGKIVNQKMKLEVLSYNFEKKVTEFKPIRHYHKERNVRGFVKVRIKTKYHGTRPKQIICTPNHKFWTNNGWMRADSLTKDSTIYHLTKRLDFVRRQFILGTLLGDSSIYWGDGNKNCGFNGSHSIDQEKYFELKMKILGNILSECKSTIGGYVGSKRNRRFNSVINKHLSDFIKEHCTVEDNKVITMKWTEKLTPISLAVWYMDDGSLSSGKEKQRDRAIFATNAFSTEELKLIQTQLKKYGIDSNIQNAAASKGNVLALTADGSEVFFNLVAPYVIHEMKYKLPQNLRNTLCYWDSYANQHDFDIIENEIVEVTGAYKDKMSNSDFQYDIEVEGNSNYFAQHTLVHNTNVSILIQDGVITNAWNRTERLPFFNKNKKHIIEGLLNSYEKGYVEFMADGQHFGELIGHKVNGNPYNLKEHEHLWIPFATYAKEHLAYKSWGKYPKDFETMQKWIVDDLMPLYSYRINGREWNGKHFVEGVVFTNPDGRMAKLRKDMFPLFYERNPNALGHKRFRKEE